MIRTLYEEIFYVSRENPAACVCGRAFLCAYFGPNKIHLVKKKAAEGVYGHFLLPLYAARQGCPRLAVAYAWVWNAAEWLYNQGGRVACLLEMIGSEPFKRTL